MQDIDYEPEEPTTTTTNPAKEVEDTAMTTEDTPANALAVENNSANSIFGSGEMKLKGRGHNKRDDGKRHPGYHSRFSGSAIASGKSRPERSIEGWILFVTGIHEEAAESDVHDTFADFGDVRSIQVNLDRRTGFVKGYVLVEYAEREEAERAIEEANGTKILGQEINVDWAFIQAPGSRR